MPFLLAALAEPAQVAETKAVAVAALADMAVLAVPVVLLIHPELQHPPPAAVAVAVAVGIQLLAAAAGAVLVCLGLARPALVVTLTAKVGSPGLEVQTGAAVPAALPALLEVTALGLVVPVEMGMFCRREGVEPFG
jgi:hypothetical protein